MAKRADDTAAGTPKPAASTLPTFSVAIIASYTGLTIVILIAALWTMRSLGQQPQSFLDPALSLAPGWAAFVSRDQIFALYLPPGWELQEEDEDVPSSGAPHSSAGSLLTTALQVPFADLGHKMDSMAIAGRATTTNEAGASFLLISHEDGPNSVMPEEAVEMLQRNGSGFDISSVVLSPDSTGQTAGKMLFDMLDITPAYRCQARLTRGQGATFMISACASQTQYSAEATMLQTILQSFQLLSD